MFPYIFKIGVFELRVYSLMYLIGILMTLYFVKKKGQKLGFSKELIENLIIITFIGAIIGARIYYVVLKWDFYSRYPKEIIAIWHGGLAIHGGIIGGIIAAYLYCKKYGIRIFQYGDMVLPFLLISQGVGRFGNFANGEAHGVPTITPPSIIFKVKNVFPEFWSTVLKTFGLKNNPVEVSKLMDLIKEKGALTVQFQGKIYELKEYVPWGISFSPKYNPPAYQDFGTLPVHPTFFYEMILNFICGYFLVRLWKDDKNIGKGVISGLYLIFYGVIRGFVTCFRADDLMIGFLRAPHLASLIMIVIGSVLVYKGKNKGGIL
ncbi:prolipoprotein diacylglyceryl transferase [Deferribacter desulfuricans SSM1]|uniref:Phosphatidylglycerol--prolipoprotein diacylglyceryl transferase n=1 Tax=Deferribacter desulfuricans (strain DSM 14783 / JCM 11476 / NBRC 101012 / SSM1) TaxID=639282 RepID=D3P976_DEFDS|nr:prolipoprotein diacylglyceryl transferase [Deferribacter desulfuricans]BAI81266.1 prolipoprotein diacylglyceryl transferase [Deferribacter desulfuricans SSM1]